MHGDKFVVNPIEQAESEAARIPNSQFFVVKGGPEAFTMIPSSATVANRVYSTFLSRVPIPPLPAPTKPRKEKVILTQALQNLAECFNDASIAKRKPTSMSFSMNSAQANEQCAQFFARYEKGEKKALTALGKDGLPVRRVSSRNEDEWSEAAFDRSGMRASLAPVLAQ